MTLGTSPHALAPSRALQGILCIVAGVCLVAVQDGMMKAMLADYSVWVLLFTRSAVAMVVLTPLIWRLGPPHRLATPLWPLHLARGALFLTGFAAIYAAFPLMPIAEVTTIFFAAPLFTALLAALWLGETIGIHRIGALVVGFCGVLVALNPTSEAFTWAAVLPLVGAINYALAQTIARRIGDRDTTLTVGLYSLTFSGLLILPLGWTVSQFGGFGAAHPHLQFTFPDRFDAGLLWLLLLGVIGMIAYMLLSRAYQVASASLVAPFDYLYLPLAVLMGYLVWHEVPRTTTLLGMALIVASGLYLAYRELRAARREGSQPAMAEAIFVPGATGPVAAHADEGPNP